MRTSTKDIDEKVEEKEKKKVKRQKMASTPRVGQPWDIKDHFFELHIFKTLKKV